MNVNLVLEELALSPKDVVAQDEWGGVNQYFVNTCNYKVLAHRNL